jgi:hypothetical protein
VVKINAEDHVTWVRQRRQEEDVLRLRRPSPEAIRRAATKNGLPVDRITEVSVLDPYF